MKKVYCTSIWCDINSCDWTISKTLARSNISLVVLALSKTPHETVRVVVNTYTILNNMYIPTSRIICMVMHCEANASSVVFESHLDAIHHLKEYQLQDLQGFWKSVSPWSRFTTAPAETAPAFQFRVKTNHKSAKPIPSPPSIPEISLCKAKLAPRVSEATDHGRACHVKRKPFLCSLLAHGWGCDPSSWKTYNGCLGLCKRDRVNS